MARKTYYLYHTGIAQPQITSTPNALSQNLDAGTEPMERFSRLGQELEQLILPDLYHADQHSMIALLCWENSGDDVVDMNRESDPRGNEIWWPKLRINQRPSWLMGHPRALVALASQAKFFNTYSLSTISIAESLQLMSRGLDIKVYNYE